MINLYIQQFVQKNVQYKRMKMKQMSCLSYNVCQINQLKLAKIINQLVIKTLV
ncbi:unnamed protein product [Paramecium primaurelia]|uniref:Uncharacterized protein n=1 Tax=Paramecium primaurelia TaxID=5886 RepID=A0A8S1M9H2_PARPR|nr:unnamed protein product [Paramecium primaurelia]